MKQQATTVELNGRALMITGPSGSGKSSLALALIERGARLIADDVTEVRDGVAYAAETHRGWLEVRGIGLVSGFPVCDRAPVAAEIRLSAEKPDRLPPKPSSPVPVFHLWAQDSRSVDKVMVIDRLLAQEQVIQ